MSDDVLIRTENVKKLYMMGHEEVWALKGISLDIHRGEFLSIMGPSGSGKSTFFNQVGALAVPEPRLITIQPWEKNLAGEIERAILKSDLGLNPSSDGQLIRLAFPPLTEDRRKEMVKLVKRMGEDAKVAVRNARREANDMLKKLEKDKDISEDDLKRGEKEIQDVTDDYVGRVDKVIADKEKDLMEI